MGNKIMLELSEEQEKLLKLALIRLEIDVNEKNKYDLSNDPHFDDLANQIWCKAKSKGMNYMPWEV